MSIDGAARSPWTPTDTAARIRIRTQDGRQWVDKKRKREKRQKSSYNAIPPPLVGGLNKMLIRIWISGNCWLFILPAPLTLPWLLIKHFVLISHISTLLQGRPLITMEWARSAQQCSQEQAPSCISIRPRPRSSHGPGTKSKESLLSVTKLFNAVIYRIFFHSIPHLRVGNETRWKRWGIVLHTNKGGGYGSPSRWWRTRLQQWGETHGHFIRSICKTEVGKIQATVRAGWDYCTALP